MSGIDLQLVLGQKDSIRSIMPLALAILCFTFAFSGCGSNPKEGESDDVRSDSTSHLIFECHPKRWSLGDSVKISVQFKKSELTGIRNGLGYVAPEEIDSMAFHNEGDKLRMDLIWVPDSLPTVGQEFLYLSFTEGYEDHEQSLLIEQSENVQILQDSKGYFYFQSNPRSYEIDSTLLE